MVFSGIVFLYAFLPLTLLAYFFTPYKYKNYTLILFSLLFYFYGEREYTLLLIFCTFVNYIAGIYIQNNSGTKKAKYVLIAALALSLGILLFYKYTDFFIVTFNSIFNTSFKKLNLHLPIGVSFFTFQSLSYTIDVYTNQCRARKDFTSLLCYVSLFPQLVAGPIVRYIDVEKQLDERNVDIGKFSLGVRCFIIGLGKKILIANVLGEIVSAFKSSGESSLLFVWLYAISYTLQIYFDFSAYSDMAIGLGRMIGFEFTKNFDYPYISTSVSEFWRRWHISLGIWFRDYVYIPLGGNRKGIAKQIRNILIVWALTGLWHGASWNFVVWGLWYAVVLIFEKLCFGKYLKKLPKIVSHIYVMAVVIVGFVIFDSTDIVSAVELLKNMFGIGITDLAGEMSLYYLKSYASVLILGVVASMPIAAKAVKRIKQSETGLNIINAAEPIFTALILIVCTAYIIDGSFNPFLYFRF